MDWTFPNKKTTASAIAILGLWLMGEAGELSPDQLNEMLGFAIPIGLGVGLGHKLLRLFKSFLPFG